MSISKSELKIFGWDSVSGYWLVIGIQQWGYFDDGNQLSSEGNTRIFPLSMSTVYAISAIRLYSLRTDRYGLVSLKSYTPSQAVFQGSVWDSGGGTSNNTAGTFFWFVVGQQQWGQNTSSGTTTSVTYPIAMSSCFNVVGNMCTNAINGFEHNVYPYTISASSFTMYTRNTDSKAFSWIAFGRQLQWGKSSSSGRATTTVTLPISMASAIYAVAISQAAASDTWSTWSSIVSNTQIKLTNNYGPGSWWLVIGKQQWGYSSSNTITFPIAFTKFKAISRLSIRSSSSGSQHHCSGHSLTGFTQVHDSNEQTLWIAVGEQQWGKGNTTTSRDNVVTLPVTYPNSYTCLVAQYISAANEKYTSQVLTTSTNSTLYLHWGRSYSSGSYVKWFTIGY